MSLLILFRSSAPPPPEPISRRRMLMGVGLSVLLCLGVFMKEQVIISRKWDNPEISVKVTDKDIGN